jgi:exonuclease SbcC
MIPLKLQLKNFISYGPQVQTVDFQAHHLICLSGKNGHGKSALLDAITWALWGQARKSGTSSKADEGLLRLGQSHMMVTLDFVAHGSTYRVRREYTVASSKATAHLDFGILDAQSGHLKHLTDKTIRATQEKINQCIGLEYESFINSAFLRQGHSNEFSKKSARDRKEILANILGLDRYEAMRKRAAEKTRLLTTEQEALEKNLDTTLKELQQKPMILGELLDLTKQLEDIKKHEDTIIHASRKLEDDKKVIDQERQHYVKLATIQEQISSQKAEYTNFFVSKVQTFRAALRTQRGVQDHSLLEQERVLLEKKIEDLRAHNLTRGQIAEETAQLKEHMQAVREKVIHEHARQVQELGKTMSSYEANIRHGNEQVVTHKKKLELLEREHQNISSEINRITQELKKSEQLDSELALLEKQFERRKNTYHSFVTQGNFLKKELDDHDEKEKLLAKAEARCPLCEQELSDTLCTSLTSRFETKQVHLRHQIDRLARVIKALKEKLIEQHETVTSLKQKQAEKNNRAHSLHELFAKEKEKAAHKVLEAQTIRECEEQVYKSTTALAEAQQKAHALLSPDSQLEVHEEYQTYTKRLRECEVRSRDLMHVEKEYHAATTRLSQVLQQTHEHTRLLAERTLQQVRKNEIRELSAALRKLHREALVLNEGLQGRYKLQEREALLISEDARLKKTLQESAQQKEKLLQRKGGLENHKHLLDRKEQETTQERERIKNLQELCIEYQTIAQALSKDGIQALLIEEAIPEIEHEANQLLSKLTDNQAHLTIESLRDLKSGATKETLDIKISDPLGIRPYEMFSGGEAFRIDFALRIAISKLLARRAGATLQLLIIDEGFGSQDEEGLAHIMEALYKIQEDFAKIIIVSHLPSMKDQFPVQFHVLKTPHGSTIHVIEQG